MTMCLATREEDIYRTVARHCNCMGLNCSDFSQTVRIFAPVPIFAGISLVSGFS